MRVEIKKDELQRIFELTGESPRATEKYRIYLSIPTGEGLFLGSTNTEYFLRIQKNTPAFYKWEENSQPLLITKLNK